MGAQGIGKIFGQGKNITTYNLARMNMLLHGVKDSEFEIFHGDTPTNDWDMLRETNPAKTIFRCRSGQSAFQLPLESPMRHSAKMSVSKLWISSKIRGGLRLFAAWLPLSKAGRYYGGYPASWCAIP